MLVPQVEQVRARATITIVFQMAPDESNCRAVSAGGFSTNEATG